MKKQFWCCFAALCATVIALCSCGGAPTEWQGGADMKVGTDVGQEPDNNVEPDQGVEPDLASEDTFEPDTNPDTAVQPDTESDVGRPETCFPDGVEQDCVNVEFAGQCGLGTQTCVDGEWGLCQPAWNPLPETCDGLDNDCDGETDEMLGFTTCGIGECEVTVQNCEDGVTNECVPEAATPELCDGEDNDCDGETDEGFGETECGLGVCEHVQPNCVAGTPVACDPFLGASDEAFDGLDNNCDGFVDNGVSGDCYTPGTSQVCGFVPQPTGECVPGTQFCGPDKMWTACVGATFPKVEVCDGLDNDCDGTTDEGFLLLNEACDTPDSDECENGTFVCKDDGTGLVCEEPEDVANIVEVCDGVDNDCDGEVDEGLGTTTCGLGACQKTVAACLNGKPQNCVPLMGSDEVCDDMDNDCDGQVDNLNPVECGLGVCKHTMVPCDAGNPIACDPFQGAAAENCNGLDDDCDGLKDEDFNLGPCTVGEGVCEITGSFVCKANGTGKVCDTLPATEKATAESCNNIDDDCDGQVDEDFMGLYGTECTAGLGICAKSGVWLCNGDPADCNVGQQNVFCTSDLQLICGIFPVLALGQPAIEVCNGLDDDCDGQVDENLNAESTCGIGACEVTVETCVNGVPAVCVPNPAQVEACDGVDNDCDGLIDENLGTTTCGVGECKVTMPACAAGVPAVCVPAEADLEVCDGKDNDCDGKADEDLGFTSCGLGVCANAVQNCVDGVPQFCDEFKDAAIEVCGDLKDNDCDGSVDEGCECDPVTEPIKPCGTDTGPCMFGAMFCLANQDGSTYWGDCVGGVGPNPESCNGIDDDCDGSMDEGLGLTPCGVGACAHVIWNCMNGVAQVCDPLDGATSEICDGKDNDCDGAVDEGQGTTTCGLGVCEHTIDNCVEGTPVFCNPYEGKQDEVCDGLDNDCDGETDEGLGVTSCGVGACFKIVPNCSGGQVQACDPLTGGKAEVCDGIDNDCDGGVDEDWAGKTKVCGVGICAHILPECSGGVTFAAMCDPTADAVLEICNNGLDDDCDGQVDEGTQAVKYYADADGDGYGHDNVFQMLCAPAAPYTATVNGDCNDLNKAANPGAAEVCDGVDNDCDGSVDESLGSTTCGVGMCQKTVQNCVAGQVQACVPGNPAAEVCDGVDNDCDGAVDENLGSTTCGVGMCQKTVQNCVAGQVQACVPGNPVAEVCDGKDNDCDGAVDDGLGSTTCGVGSCTKTVDNCVGGVVQQCAPGNPAPETCDAVDNDCDGGVDEDWAGQDWPCGQGVCLHMVPLCQNGQSYMDQCDPLAGAVPEVCGDGLDNDCNGVVDNGCP